jgi:acyl-coenzyme A synthetase/AMP-(fatty) acid ligase
MLVTSGENVYPTEVENVLFLHPAIIEAAVIGVPGEKWGQTVTHEMHIRHIHPKTLPENLSISRSLSSSSLNFPGIKEPRNVREVR